MDFAAEGRTGEQIAADMLQQVMGMSERFACRAVGLHRSTYRRLPAAHTGRSRRRSTGVAAFLRHETSVSRAVKIASMVYEHTRESLLHLAERSITAERVVTELERVCASTGGPAESIEDGQWTGDDFGCAATVLR